LNEDSEQARINKQRRIAAAIASHASIVTAIDRRGVAPRGPNMGDSIMKGHIWHASGG